MSATSTTAPTLSVVVLATQEGASEALASTRGQLAGLQTIVAGRLECVSTTLADVDERLESEAGPAELRRAALELARAPYAVIVDAHERLRPGALSGHLSALEADAEVVASYGLTAIHDLASPDSEGAPSRVRVRPSNGKGGALARRLVKSKDLLGSSAAIVWRRAALQTPPFGDYTAPEALRMALGLALARGERSFAFRPEIVAERAIEPIELLGQEEIVRLLMGELFGPDSLDERTEQRARRRLARRLVSIGKLHYRAEDYERAGRFFDEAVKTAPSDFRGRRYQFLNFVKNTLQRDG